MLSFRVESTQLDQLALRLEDMAYRLTDLRGLALRVGELMDADVERKGLAGLDFEGDPLAPLSEATLAWRRPPRAGDGPPLAPQEGASRLIAGFDVGIEELGWDHLQVVGSWPGLPFLGYHTTGYKNALTGTEVPARDVVGITPTGWLEIEGALDEWTDDVLAGNP